MSKQDTSFRWNEVIQEMHCEKNENTRQQDKNTSCDREKAIVYALDLIAFIKRNNLDYPCLGDDLWDFINEQTSVLHHEDN